MNSARLFSKFDSHSAIEQLKKKLSEKLRLVTESQLQNSTIDEWIASMKSEYEMIVPKFDRENIEGDLVDVQLNARHFRNRFHFDQDEDSFIQTPGTEIIYRVPFEGDPQIFGCSGNTIYTSFPIAEVSGNKLTFRYQTVDHNADAINSSFEKDLKTIEGHLGGLEGAFADWNRQIEIIVRAMLGDRIAKFEKDKQLATQLKYGIKKRQNAPQTFKVPDVKRKIAPAAIPQTQSTEAPDPTLAMEHYEHILTVAKNMVKVMEFSPKAFHELGEEALRFHFLVQLNGQYEGMATGETFNYLGKTDILIKYNGHNLFVGECKFWRGPKSYSETIDQILNYVTWRDTKIAIFVFCKDTDPGTVIAKIPETTHDHPMFVKESPTYDASSFRYHLKHPGDSTKELMLTVLVFNIPTVP